MIATEGQVLDLGSDVGLRKRWFLEASFQHPAKLHLGLLQWIVERYTSPGDVIADPMAGVGSILLAAAFQRDVIAREIEPKWLALAHDNAAHLLRRAGLFVGQASVGQADARAPWGYQADHIIFSPPYGCEATRGGARKGILSPKTRAMVEAGQLGEAWTRLQQRTSTGQAAAYLFWYGQHEAQMGHFTGGRYWQAMTDIYRNAYQALRGGYMVLVIKDHIRKGQHVCVAGQTVRLCEELGFRLQERHYRRVHPLSLWQRRRKERGEPVIELEDVLVFRKAELWSA